MFHHHSGIINMSDEEKQYLDIGMGGRENLNYQVEGKNKGKKYQSMTVT